MIRKSAPYSNCTSRNLEAPKLFKSAGQNLNFSYGGRVDEGNYDIHTCFSTCLQRKIFTECGCFDIREAYAYHYHGRMCGKTNNITEQLFSGRIAACFYEFNLQLSVSQENENFSQFYKRKGKDILELCLAPYQVMISDFNCIKKVKDLFNNVKNTHCNCPPPCRIMNYDLSTGLAKWPTSDPNLDNAYNKLMPDYDSHGLMAYLKGLNNTVSDDIVKYLSASENRREIMKNFARVTVYEKSLSLIQMEEFAAYTLLDILSDLGMSLFI